MEHIRGRVLRFLLAGLVGLTLVCGAYTTGRAADLNDGISSYTEDLISNYDSLSSLGTLDINIGYVIFMAKSKAYKGKVRPKTAKDVSTGDYTGNINSVVLRPGSIVHGDIYIIDTSQGSKTQIISGNTISSENLGSDVTISGSTTWDDVINYLSSGGSP